MLCMKSGANLFWLSFVIYDTRQKDTFLNVEIGWHIYKIKCRGNPVALTPSFCLSVAMVTGAFVFMSVWGWGTGRQICQPSRASSALRQHQECSEQPQAPGDQGHIFRFYFPTITDHLVIFRNFPFNWERRLSLLLPPPCHPLLVHTVLPLCFVLT